jgi:hypothetical protein
MMRVIRIRLGVVVLGLAAVPLSCGSGTGPGGESASAVASGMDGLAAGFTGNRAFRSQMWLGERFAYAGAAAVSAPPWRRGREGGNASVTLLAGPGPGSRTPAGSLFFLPLEVRGRTYAWDGQLQRYVWDATAPGAPADGVRFRLYDADTVRQVPAAPLVDLGFADIADRSTALNGIIGVTLASGSTTTAAYRLTDLRGSRSGGFNAWGWVEGEGRVDLDLDLVLSQISYAADFVISGSNSYVARLLMTMTATTGRRVLEWRVSRGGDTTAVDLSAEATGPYTGTLRRHGALIANISGELDTPLIVGVGDQTSLEEIQAARRIVAGFVTLLDHANGAFAPALLVFP